MAASPTDKYKARRAKSQVDLGNKLFTKKRGIDSLNQDIAEQFCPDLASFNRELELGEDFMMDVMDSVPIQVSRECSNAVGANLRPQDQLWFRSTTMDDDADAVEENARGLESITKQMWRGIYHPRAQLITATKEADRFYVNFGQAVIGANEAPTRDHLLFKNYHIKDCAWLENDIGEVDQMHRRQKMSARAMVMRFGDKVHDSIKKCATKDPEKEFEVRVITMPSEEYDDMVDAKGAKRKLPFVMVHIDVEHDRVLREGGLVAFNYIVPRWHRFAGSQYAFSPAALTALPDARMAQMLSQILLDAGEKAVDPPIVAKQEIVIGEPNIMAGGITWVDIEHDKKLRDAIEAMQINVDMRVGVEMRKDVRELLSRAFYLDRIQLPEVADRTTAFEIARRLEQHARNLLPLFEPIQIDYNTRLLDTAFAFLQNMKKIDWSKTPSGLANTDFTWAFESPIQQARYRVMVEQFRDTLQVVAAAKQMGLNASPIHLDIATRDAVRGIDGPATWRKTQDEQAQEAQENAQKQQMAEAIGALHQAGEAGAKVGDAGQKLGLIPKGGPIAPNAEQAVPSDYAVPASYDTQSPHNAMRVLDDAMRQLGGGTGAEPSPAPGPGAPGSPSVGIAVPQGNYNDTVAMQRNILAKLGELEQALKAPRQISINRDKGGRITGASAGGGKHGGRKAA